MAKTFTLYLSTSPYSYENTFSTIRIAEASLNKGHSVNLIASADGIYCFLKKQKAKRNYKRGRRILGAHTKRVEGLSLRRLSELSPGGAR